MSAGLSCTAWRASPFRRALRSIVEWLVVAWIVVGWLLVIPAWFYFGAPF